MSLERQPPLRLVALAVALIAWPPVRSTTSRGLDRRAHGSRCRPYSPRDSHIVLASTHVPVGVFDFSTCKAKSPTTSFNPRPCGGRRLLPAQRPSITQFQSTPPRRGGVDERCDHSGLLLVSTHAPVRGGDQLRAVPARAAHGFNPRPREGGDTGSASVTIMPTMFQSTPP